MRLNERIDQIQEEMNDIVDQINKLDDDYDREQPPKFSWYQERFHDATDWWKQHRRVAHRNAIIPLSHHYRELEQEWRNLISAMVYLKFGAEDIDDLFRDEPKITVDNQTNSQ